MASIAATPAIFAYPGAVSHTRLRPVRHRLRYAMVPFLLDLGRLSDADRQTRLFSVNKRNLFAFYEADHGRVPGKDAGRGAGWLAGQIRAVAGARLDGPQDAFADHRVQVLAYPRVFGYVFNPLTVFYLTAPDGQLAAIVHQVNNTFGERHFYVARVTAPANVGPPITHTAAKDFYVSPFNSRTGRYRFHLSAPGAALAVAILHNDDAGPLLHACFTGRRVAVSDRFLLGAALTNPLMTHKAMAGIHWEALRLWWKGVSLVPRPAALTTNVSIAHQPASCKQAGLDDPVSEAMPVALRTIG